MEYECPYKYQTIQWYKWWEDYILGPISPKRHEFIYDELYATKKHGHDFFWMTARCTNCGLWEKDYYFQDNRERGLCDKRAISTDLSS